MMTLSVLLCALAPVCLTVDKSAAPRPVAKTFQGVFIEDVSHAADVLMTEKGFREEAVDLLAALKPGFVRFPGGCAAQGRTFEEQFDWKRTICAPEDRPCVSNLWGYVTNFRLGYYEYFLLCERLGAEPVPVVAAGMTCHHFSKPQRLKSLGPEMDAVAQDVCDLIEFANGGTSTVWGRKRAAMGHPKPFGMKYLSIGNEDVGTNYLVRYRAMAEVLRKRYPDIRLIAAAHRAMERDQGYPAARQALTADVADVLDEHFYFSRDWLKKSRTRFDGYPRTQRLAVTEYAHKERGAENTEASALLDIAFLLGLLRNADLVEMTSYAPTFAWTGKENWRPNLIGFDGTRFQLTPNYALQCRFAEDRPDEVLPATVTGDDADLVAVVGRRAGRLQVQCVNLTDAARELTVDAGTGVRTLTVPARTYRCCSLEEAKGGVEELEVFSPSMGRTFPVTVLLPHDYARGTRRHPVVYCLHGVGGTSRTFFEESTRAAVDAYGFIAVLPSGGRNWWFDSPVVASNRLETFVARELVSFVDRRYRTVANRWGRALVGASMGGQGACWIGFRHRDVFGAVGNIYGGVDFRAFKDPTGLDRVLGPLSENTDRWKEHCALAASEALSDGDVDLITCVGAKDFFLDPNRRMHARLAARGVGHSYLEIDGWDLPHQSHHEDFKRMVEPIVYGRLNGFFVRNRGGK